MNCPYCGRRGIKQLKGYCCKAHYELTHSHQKQKVVLPCKGCGVTLKRAPSAVAASGIAYCTKCKRATGENHYKYNDGSYVDKAGYRMVLHNGKYIKEHRLVWQESNNATLFESGTIHHIRFDLPHNKLYNDPDNLLLLSDRDHARLHRAFERGDVQTTYGILKSRGRQQLHYPVEIGNFIAVTWKLVGKSEDPLLDT